MTTLKRLALLVVVLTVLLIPRPASLLETEVRHGESPKWSGPTVGRYAVTVVGYYTDRPELVRAGVRKVEWQSDAQAKRRAEMLALRAAFLDWFVEEWVREGGVRADQNVPGYGLGLAMVHDTVDLYGGELAIDSSPLGGARFSLRLPGR